MKVQKKNNGGGISKGFPGSNNTSKLIPINDTLILYYLSTLISLC